eukprot:3414846-Amphidinium_carterae.1
MHNAFDIFNSLATLHAQVANAKLGMGSRLVPNTSKSSFESNFDILFLTLITQLELTFYAAITHTQC